MSDDARNKVKPYLDEIADRLWSNNAAVMVGAGFSRNAKPVGTNTESFPNWQELGDIFYRKLHGRSPDEEARYLSLLKLAEQVQAAFGRPALNDLLRHAIPNLDYEPSPLHGQLLNLPWRDVFTTNYDTLLERARASVTLKHYDVVTTDEDLLYANQPRIVKLHGSFPSAPFVITEEDYRRYPSDHAPFVNTMRQSLLENTLCLIGFSGDDPNFLQWIGWIRDYFGPETVPIIYLVGVFDALTEADRKLLDRRGIVVVDLSVYSMDDGKAVGSFLDYLKGRATRATDWPTVSRDVRSWATDSDPNRYLEIAAEWRRQRREYPGWVVIPDDRRRFLWLYTESWLWHVSHISPTDRAGLGTPLDLDLAFELAWRLDRCLFPVTEELAAFLEEIAAKYSDTTVRLPEKSDWTTKSVFEAVSDIRLWLLRHYREEGLAEQWKDVRRPLEDDFERLLPEHRVRFRLEEALQALYRFDPAEAKQLLVNWQSADDLPFWSAKRAALLAELGEVAVAQSILESSLSAIRQQLSLNPVIEDFTLVSQESVVMYLLWAVESDKTLGERDTEDGELLGELSERWNELSRYKCDPRRDVALASAVLRHRSEDRGQESKTHRFDLGVISRTLHFKFPEEAVSAYALLRTYEDIGIPYRMGRTTFVQTPIEPTIFRVRRFSPHWALASIVRVGDAKATDGLFDREYLADLTRDEVDSLLEIYLPAFERTITMVNKPDWTEAKTFELLARTLPEVISRLCYKCSPEYRVRLVGSLSAIYESRRKRLFGDVRRFADRLFDSMSVKERARVVPSLIDFPMPDDLDEIGQKEFLNPVLLVHRNEWVGGDAFSITTDKIDELLYQLAENGRNRDWTATKLVWLHDRGKLNQRQSERLGKLLWVGVEAPGVPLVTGFYGFTCMNLSHPKGIDPEPRVKQRLRTMIKERMGGNGLDEVLDELRSSAGTISWSRADASELVTLLFGCWNGNKRWLRHKTLIPFRRPSDNTKRTANKAVHALAAVFSQLPEKVNEEAIESLREFLADLRTHDIQTRVLQVATLTMSVEDSQQVLDDVAGAMLDKDHDVVADALSAARILAKASVESESRAKFAPLATLLAQGIQWRNRVALAYRLWVAADLVKNWSWFFSDQDFARLLAGLLHIAEETSSGVRGNDEEGIIPIRASASSLAFALFEYYEASGSDQPEAVRRWRELCCDPDEFAEVRNAWMLAGD